MSYYFDVVVVGAGVVGLACAKYFTNGGFSTLVIEKESSFGLSTSSRNSEVIHAGIYYSKGSNKASLCVRGKQLLYEYCLDRNIPYKKIGKWLVAQSISQTEKLHHLKQVGLENGVEDLQFLDSHAISAGEPELCAAAVLYSPSTGILDSHAYMQSLAYDVESGGGIIAYNTPCLGADVKHNGFEIVLGGAAHAIVRSEYFINSAGLGAIHLANKIQGLCNEKIPNACFAKGNYCAYMGKVPFQRLIYPVPETGGLGIHLTLDMSGQARFGPDVEWVPTIDYQVNENAAKHFAQAISSYWPRCDVSKLVPAYCGIRPKLGTPQDFSTDFLLQFEEDHGITGLVNLLGIESPGLTASLAIGEKIFQSVNK